LPEHFPRRPDVVHDVCRHLERRRLRNVSCEQRRSAQLEKARPDPVSFAKDGWDAWQADGGLALVDHEWEGSHSLGKYDGKYWLSYIGGAEKSYSESKSARVDDILRQIAVR
jgi:hypothetical protein